MYRSRAAAIILIDNVSLNAAWLRYQRAVAECRSAYPEDLDACEDYERQCENAVRDVAATVDHPDAMRLAAIDFEDRADDLMGTDDLGARLYKAKAWQLAALVCA